MKQEIVKGLWIDAPYQAGFRDKAGIYLVLAGSNSAYGNMDGGFSSVAEAEAYNRTHLNSTYQVVVRK